MHEYCFTRGECYACPDTASRSARRYSQGSRSESRLQAALTSQSQLQATRPRKRGTPSSATLGIVGSEFRLYAAFHLREVSKSGNVNIHTEYGGMSDEGLVAVRRPHTGRRGRRGRRAADVSLTRRSAGRRNLRHRARSPLVARFPVGRTCPGHGAARTHENRLARRQALAARVRPSENL